GAFKRPRAMDDVTDTLSTRRLQLSSGGRPLWRGECCRSRPAATGDQSVTARRYSRADFRRVLCRGDAAVSIFRHPPAWTQEGDRGAQASRPTAIPNSNACCDEARGRHCCLANRPYSHFRRTPPLAFVRRTSQSTGNLELTFRPFALWTFDRSHCAFCRC